MRKGLVVAAAAREAFGPVKPRASERATTPAEDAHSDGLARTFRLAAIAGR